VYLRQIADTLYRRCRESNKLQWVLADGEDALATAVQDNGDYYRKIKSAWKLPPEKLAVLDAITRWREQTARSRDKPRSWIIDDNACLALAQALPQSKQDLQQLGILHPGSLRRYGAQLLEVVAASRNTPMGQLPTALPAPLQAEQRGQLKKLRHLARDIAQRLAVAPEALLAGRDYETLIRQAAGDRVDIPVHWRGWREDLVILPLQESLQERGS
jgi:ribonuclease D